MYFDWKKHLTLLLLSRFTDLLVCLVKMTSLCVIYLSFPGTLILSVFSFPYLFSWQHKLTMSSHLLRLCLHSVFFKKCVSTHDITAAVYIDLTATSCVSAWSLPWNSFFFPNLKRENQLALNLAVILPSQNPIWHRSCRELTSTKPISGFVNNWPWQKEERGAHNTSHANPSFAVSFKVNQWQLQLDHTLWC